MSVSKKTGAKYLSLQIKDPYKKGDASPKQAPQQKDEELGF